MVGVRSVFCAATFVLAGLLVVGSSTAGAESSAQIKAKELALSEMPAGWTAIKASGSGNGADSCIGPFQPPKKYVSGTVSYGQSGGSAVQEILATGPAAGATYQKVMMLYAGCTSVKVDESGATFTGHGITMPFTPVGDQSRAFAFRLADGNNPLGVDVVVFREGSTVGSVLLRVPGLPDADQMQQFVSDAMGNLKGQAGSP